MIGSEMNQRRRFVLSSCLFVLEALNVICTFGSQSLVVVEAAQQEINVPPFESPVGSILSAGPAESGNAAEDYIQTIRSVSKRLEALGIQSERDYAKGLPLTPDEIQGIMRGSRKKASAFAPRYYPAVSSS